MEDQNKTLIEWLNSAYAMEKQIIDTLQKHASDAEEMPEMQQKIEEHREQSEQHANMVEECIKNLGGDTSRWEEFKAKLSGGAAGLMPGLTSDTLINNAIAEYATESTEIAFYLAIQACAEQNGNDDVAELCEKIISEEEEMAGWIESNLSTLVEQRMGQN